MRAVSKVLHFPLAGVSRNLSVRNNTQPLEDRVYAAPFAMNVRSVDTFEERRRGGSRPATVPVKGRSQTIEARYRARRVYADGTCWYASRTGDATDFAQSGDGGDVTRPAMGNVALRGREGEAITAIFATDDRALFVATDAALWMFQGELNSGPLALISPTVGCVSQDAWAWDGKRVFVLSRQGVFAFMPGEPPTEISGDIPKALSGAEWATMYYDREWNVLNIVADTGSWTLELDGAAWWPFATDESGSYVAIGPFRLGARDDKDGMLDELSMTLADGSDDVTVQLYGGACAEDALMAAEEGVSPFFTITAREGRNLVKRPRMRSGWAVMVLRSAGAWAFESATATVKELGRLR